MFNNLFIYELFYRSSRSRDRIAFKKKECSVSYGDLMEAVAEVANWLSRNGVGENRSVAVGSEFHPMQQVIILLGVIEAGGMPHILPLDRAKFLEAGIVHEFLVHAGDAYASGLVSFGLSRHGGMRPVADPVPEPCVLVNSSGSTAFPKVIIQSQRGVMRNMVANIKALGITEGQRSLCVLPVFYSYALIAQVLSHLLCGAMIVFEQLNLFILNPAKAIAAERITNVFMVPTMLRQIVLFHQQHPGTAARTGLNFLTIGGSYVDSSTLQAARELFGCRLIKTYGLAEAGPRVSSKFMDGPGSLDPTNVGAPIGGVGVRIVDETGASVEEGMAGRVVIESESIFCGYYPMRKFYGWRGRRGLLTHDIGRFINGELHLIGRAGHHFRFANRVVWFREIEEVVYSTRQFYKIEIRESGDRLSLEVFPVANCRIDPADVIRLLERQLNIDVEQAIEIRFVSAAAPKSFK